jgi:hypothetical protein
MGGRLRHRRRPDPGMAILAQANSVPQNILTLLRWFGSHSWPG